jgi:hypothetical protein
MTFPLPYSLLLFTFRYSLYAFLGASCFIDYDSNVPENVVIFISLHNNYFQMSSIRALSRFSDANIRGIEVSLKFMRTSLLTIELNQLVVNNSLGNANAAGRVYLIGMIAIDIFTSITLVKSFTRISFTDCVLTNIAAQVLGSAGNQSLPFCSSISASKCVCFPCYNLK